MSSPACSISSDEEDSKSLAEMREAMERKAQKDREWRERREREKRKQKERKEKEAREVQEIAETTRRLQEAYSAAAERAQEWIEKKARAENERLRAALTHVQESAEQDKADGSRDTETEEDGEVSQMLKTPRWRVVASRPNTAKVIIVRPAPKGKGTDEVSASEFGRGSDTDQDLGSFLPLPVRQVHISGGTLRSFPRTRVNMYPVPREEGPV